MQTISSREPSSRGGGEPVWERFELATSGSASVHSGVAAITRAANHMEVWWVGKNGSVQDAYWIKGEPWRRYELAPAGSASEQSGVAAITRSSNHMEMWWIGENGSVQGAFWIEGKPWVRYEIAPAGSASGQSGIAAVTKGATHMEVWWVGQDGSVQDAFWTEGKPWVRYEIAPAGSAAVQSQIAAVTRSQSRMEIWWVGSNRSLQGASWVAGKPWVRYELGASGSASAGGGIAAVTRASSHIETLWVSDDSAVKGAFFSDFDPQFLGAAFSPYVGAWKGTSPNAKVPLWNSYSQQDIVQMLKVVATEFNRISTYSMGYAGYHPPTTPWNKLDSNCLVAGAAAQLNQQTGALAIQVAQGIYQHENPTHQQIEIEAALSAAKAANAVYPRTVTSLVFTNEYVVNARTADAVNAMIVNNKRKARDLNIRVGVRSHTFGEIANSRSAFYSELKNLIKNCDFIQCNLYPGDRTPNPTEGVQQVDRAFKQILAAVASINPQCEVMIGETGWPSQGYSFNKTNNTVANLLAYYEALNNWAKKNRVVTYLFEAIDEPWKSAQDGKSPPSEPWKGPKGAEGHYGLWFLDAQGKYIRKNAR